MKKLYALLFFTFSLVVNAQIVNIPDANFKAKLLLANSNNQIASTESFIYIEEMPIVTSYNSIDVNGDGEIQVSEAEAIKYLNVSNSNISDLTGIEAFINLELLDCENNVLSSVDINLNTFLRYLSVNQNQLSHLNVSQNTQLEQLHSDNNQLTSLDVSQNVQLEELYCESNQLTSLDVSQNIELKSYFCNFNQLSAIDVSQNVNLRELQVINNLLTSIDISNNVLLSSLVCSSNFIETLDFTQNLVLFEVTCNNNLLTSLDFGNNPLMSSLSCDNNRLEYLNLKNGIDVWLANEFNGNPDLRYICVSDTGFQAELILEAINSYGYTNCHVNSYCSFTPGGEFYEIEGQVKLDINGNGCDALDINLPYFVLGITDGTTSGSVIANSFGNYKIPVPSGSYTITSNLENPTYFTISPENFTVDFPSQTSPFTQNFCVAADGFHSDVEVILVPISAARPGFDVHYKIIYRNKGTQVENGTVSLIFDDTVLDYVSSSPVYNSLNTNTYVWNFTNLLPFEIRVMDIVFNVNGPTETPAVNIEDLLTYTTSIATLNTDESVEDNSFTLIQTVVGSYDPNDKTCLEGEIIEPSMIGKYVHYMIRFENTGTYPAQNIVVKDMIDITKFDISTLIPLESSHDFYTKINDNKVEFIFENINLDFNDATNDGYVIFKIKTLPTLNIGDTFSNEANIYFDYNFPITTNNYVTTIQTLSNPNFEFENEFRLFPNPVGETLNVQSKNDMEIKSLEIYNVIGQLVIAVPNPMDKIDVSSLESGTYFVKVNTERGSANTKVIKK